MRKSFIIFGILLASCGGGDATSSTTTNNGGTGSTTVDVFTPGNTFSPFTVSVPVGGTVNFNISGTPHNVIFNRTSVSGAPSDINVVNNVVVSRTFTAKGTFPYDCTVHPGMSGQVVVQ